MSKKKQPKNGFYYFMVDVQQELRQQGRFVPMREMPTLAGPRWSKLPDVEKQAYNLKAKQEKLSVGGAQAVYRRGRMDCTGELLSERRDLAAETELRKRQEKEQLHVLLRGIDVTGKVFYFIDILSLCEIKDHPKERFLPCELAVVEYTLASGILRSTHKFLDPGPIPMGYRFQAQSESSQSHNIPIGFDLGDRDYRRVMAGFEEFVSRHKDPPVLFAKGESVDQVEWCLKWLADQAGVQNRFGQVYEVEMLLVELASHCGAVLTLYQAQDMLKTSTYDYEQGTRCLWHEQREIKVCSLGAVKIYAYILSDYLCPKFHLPLTGSHLPEQPDTPAGTVMSLRSSPLPTVQGMYHAAATGLGRGKGRGSVQQAHQSKMLRSHDVGRKC